ncbi:MAG: endonuclease domain-containing protein [Rikenellaceae bacterium]|nr:endonuclease domain-containing protein [Rikenellaceae bacterium]
MNKQRTHNQPEQLDLRKRLRRKTTPEENALWTLLKGKQLDGFKWRRQFSVGPYVMDFYCPQAKLAVELDGIQHSADEVIKYDEARTKYLEREGIKVLRVPNQSVWKESDWVINVIKDNLR